MSLFSPDDMRKLSALSSINWKNIRTKSQNCKVSAYDIKIKLYYSTEDSLTIFQNFKTLIIKINLLLYIQSVLL